MTSPRPPSARNARRLAGRDEPDQNRLLAQAADALKRGALPEVEHVSRLVLAKAPRQPDALNFLGLVALGRGRGADAVPLFEQAIAAAPGHAMMRCNLAFALRSAGRLEDAVREAGEAARLDPNLPPAQAVLGTLLADLGRAEEALAPLKRALELAPTLGRVHFALANALRTLGRDDEAATHYEAALKADPGHGESWTLLGWLQVEQRRYEEAARWFRSGLVARRASRWWPGDGAAPVPPPRAEPVNDLKLMHDAEQFAYLAERGLVPGGFADRAKAYEAARAAFARDKGVDATATMSPAELGPLAETYARIVRWLETPAQDGPVLGGWDRAEVEARYAVEPGVTWVDDLLTPKALDALRRFCLESTIWNDVGHNYRAGATRRAYLGTYAHDGFCCPLLFQIAEELRRAMPSVFKDHRLRQMWGYKYEPHSEGIDLHGDNAAVNVNFWLTPDEANLSPESGGLVVYPVEAPADWNFDDMNKDPAKIRSFLDRSGVAPVNVPHRQNRAVIFNSDLFHATAPLNFKPGYENRRINVTMLFGRRHG